MFNFDHIEIETIKQGNISKNSFKELEGKENEKQQVRRNFKRIFCCFIC